MKTDKKLLSMEIKCFNMFSDVFSIIYPKPIFHLRHEFAVIMSAPDGETRELDCTSKQFFIQKNNFGRLNIKFKLIQL